MPKAIPVVFCLWMAALLAQPIWSQEARGRIVGRVTDSSGAVIPQVTVRLTHAETGVSRSTTANAEGNYAAPLLPAGMYEITAERQGFKAFARRGVELRIADNLEVNIVLEVGQMTESVTVTAETPLLETASASSGQVVDSRRLADLPVGLGMSYQLLTLSSSVAYTSANQDLLQPWEPLGMSNYSLAGSGTRTSEWTMDGASNSVKPYSGQSIAVPAFSPPVEAVNEMKVQTVTFDGTVSQTQGSVINVSLKSGTNALHGTVYYSDVPTALTANSFFSNRDRVARPDSSSHRWGTVLSGPLWLPKLYNGKNRTFFMYSYEGAHYATQRPANWTVPTAAQRAGNLSSLLALGGQYQIYNPFTRRSIGGGRYQSDPIAGNVIPPNLISPIATKMMDPKIYTLPVTAGTTADGSDNVPGADTYQYDKYYGHIARLDHNFSDNHRMFVRANQAKTVFKTRNPWGPDTVYSNLRWFYWWTGLNVDDVYTLTPSTVMNLRGSFARNITAEDSFGVTPPGKDLTQYGFSNDYNNRFDPKLRQLPGISMGSEYSSFGGGSAPTWWLPSENRAGVAAFDHLRGSHELKFGFEYRQYRQGSYITSVRLEVE